MEDANEDYDVMWTTTTTTTMTMNGCLPASESATGSRRPGTSHRTSGEGRLSRITSNLLRQVEELEKRRRRRQQPGSDAGATGHYPMHTPRTPTIGAIATRTHREPPAPPAPEPPAPSAPSRPRRRHALRAGPITAPTATAIKPSGSRVLRRGGSIASCENVQAGIDHIYRQPRSGRQRLATLLCKAYEEATTTMTYNGCLPLSPVPVL